jgi:polysaccharide export outer membrane protein
MQETTLRRSLRTACGIAGCLFLGLGLLACSGPGSYVWVTDLPLAVAGSSDDYLIRDGDTVSIRVFNQEPLSTHARVRTDGRLAMPVLGDIDVRGKRPSEVRAELERRLKDYVNSPSVTITIDESQPISVAVLGEVGHGGVFPVDPRVTVGYVIAQAGGINEFASRDRIFVVRKSPQPMRVRFTFDEVRRGEPHAAAFVLHEGDLVVVE